VRRRAKGGKPKVRRKGIKGELTGKKDMRTKRGRV